MPNEPTIEVSEAARRWKAHRTATHDIDNLAAVGKSPYFVKLIDSTPAFNQERMLGDMRLLSDAYCRIT